MTAATRLASGETCQAPKTARGDSASTTATSKRADEEPTKQQRRPQKQKQQKRRRRQPTPGLRVAVQRVGLPGSRHLLAGVALCTLAVCLLAPPHHQPNGFPAVEGLRALKALAKTFVYQQLTMRKNFVPLPVPIPVPIEINEPPVYLKGKPKYVTVYKPKPTAPPVSKPTTVYHMPIYSPTYEYMSVDPMSAMYGHVAPVVYNSPYGKHLSSSAYKSPSDSESYPLRYGSPSSSSSGSSGSSSSQLGGMMNFNDYDDDSGQYYVGRGAARSHARLLSATAGDYLSGATLDLRHRNDRAEDAAAAGQSGDDLATSSSSAASKAASVTSYGSAAADAKNAANESNNDEEDDELDDQEQDSSSTNGVQSAAAPTNEDESYDEDEDSATATSSQAQRRSSSGGGGPLKRSKRQVYYQSGYDGKENCEGFPLEINVRSRLKLDQIFPIFGKSQMKKCIKPKRPFHILPPPPPEEPHYG